MKRESLATKNVRGTLRKDRARKALGLPQPAKKRATPRKVTPTPSAPEATIGQQPSPSAPEATIGPQPPLLSTPVVVSFYRTYVPLLMAEKRLEPSDYAAFELMAQTYGMAAEALRIVSVEGYFRYDENLVQRKHPGIQVHRDATMTFVRLASRFGLTPLDRERNKPPKSDDDEDPFEAFVREKLAQP